AGQPAHRRTEPQRAGAHRPAVRGERHPVAGRPGAAQRRGHRRVLLTPATMAPDQARDGSPGSPRDPGASREPGAGSREPGASRDPAPAVTRSLRILTLLAEAAGTALTLSDIARALGLAKSSTANLCLALEQGEMIQRTAEGYRLGRRTAELGGAYALGFNQVREFFDVCAASPVLAADVVPSAMPDGADVLYVARPEGRSPYSL